MGKKLRDEDLKLNIIVNGDKAKKELGDLEKSTRDLTTKNKELRAEKEKLERAGKKESDRYKEVTAEIRENNKVIKTNETRMKELRSQIGLTGLTLKQLRMEQTRLKRLMDSSTYGTAQWKQYRAELNKVEAQMAKVRSGSRSMRLSVSNLANGFNKYFNLIAAGVATLTGVVFSVGQWTKGLVGLDDALADVMKTTGLTRKEVRNMYTDFKYLNTRTPRKELLLLAEEAGRLGLKGKQNIEDFVEVANKIKVALGDDLGGDAEKAIREVGKLVEVYKVGDEYGTDFKESLNKVGSAINEVSANSNSQAEYQIGFMKRMGGTSQQAKISAADILGYASTLDQLGQSQEMAATAMGKTIISMFKDSAEYAKIANMEHVKFYDLLKTDANKAFLAVLEGLNGNNEGLATMANKLDDLGIDGARAVQVLAALSSNTKMVREQQDMANTAMKEGTSLTNEYNIKNNNLAGSMDKVGRAIRAKFINSKFLEWMEKVVAKAAELTEIPLAEKIQEEQAQLNILMGAITNVNTSQENRNDLIAELQKTYPDFLENLDSEKVTNEQLRDRLKEVNEQYENKILLAIKEDKLSDNYRERTDLKLEELDLLKQIAEKEIKITELKEKQSKFTPTTPDWTEYSRQIFLEETALNNYNNTLEKNREKVAELKQEEIELNKAISDMMTTATGNSSTGGNGGSSGTAGTSKYQEEEDSPLQMESWMTKESVAMAKFLAEKKASEQEWTDFLKEQVAERMAVADKEVEESVKNSEELARAQENLKADYAAAVSEIASALTNMAEEGSAAYIAFFAIEKAAALAEVWLNYAKEMSAISAYAATMGPYGVAYEAAMASKAGIRTGLNIGIIAAQTIAEVSQFALGKYPDAQNATTLKTGTYGSKPQLGIFNEEPGYPEMVVDGHTFKTMQMNYPELIQAIYSIRDGRNPQKYASGKYDQGSPSQAYIQTIDVDKFDKAVSRLEKLEWNISYSKLEKLRKDYEAQQKASAM